MQNMYDEVGFLDRRCYNEFALSEDLLMEHAADGMADFIRNHFKKKSRILIATGSGNNGADGITLARLLHKDYAVSLYLVKEPKSPMCRLQFERAKKIGIIPLSKIDGEYDVVVDAVLGTGFSGAFGDELRNIMQQLNNTPGLKIACDVPSGLSRSGVCEKDTFKADVTLTMGALKKGMFLDEAKDFVGEIEVLDLGVSREVYEVKSNWRVLDKSDMILPTRERHDTHKGTFGHTAVIAGEKIGAGVLCAKSALHIGSGLVSVVDCQSSVLPIELMRSDHLPTNTTAIAVGMGLGNVWGEKELDELLDNKIPTVVDADMFYAKQIQKLLTRDNVVLTPHPKEFCVLLKNLNLADIDVANLQKNRFEYVEKFSKTYPNVVLLLKGANVIIAQDSKFYINPFGSAKLAKGGSGDVLTGLIAGLLAQNYTPLEATLNGSLIHTKLAEIYKGNDFSLTPLDLIESISKL